MTDADKIERLEAFIGNLRAWQKSPNAETRRKINESRVWVRREVLEAGSLHTMTISPPPAVGGLIMRNVDPFDNIFEPPYLTSLIPNVIDMIEETIGVIKLGATEVHPRVSQDADIQKGYAFIAMPIVKRDHLFDDVLDAIKEAAKRCGIHAERVDEPASNERITDRILESIRRAEFVIADLTDSRPNVFYEAGYAQGLRKTPIYIARNGTKLEFDLKDYPVIFFGGIKQLKDELENRIRGLADFRKNSEAVRARS